MEMNRVVGLLFITLFAVCAAVPTFDVASPARQRQIHKLTARRRDLQRQIGEVHQLVEKLTTDRQVAELQLQEATKTLTFATEECRKDKRSCDKLAGLGAVVKKAQDQLNTAQKILSEAAEPEMLQWRKNELAGVMEQLVFVSKMLKPKPSVKPHF